MARKKEKNISNVVVQVDEDRQKFGKKLFKALFALVLSIPICWIFSLLFGKRGSVPVEGDNHLTALLQNYNFILATIILVMIIGYIFTRIKKELNKRFVTDDKILMYGFFTSMVALIAIIFVCSAVYPINSVLMKTQLEDGSDFLYGFGRNSVVTVMIFVIAVVIFVLEAIVWGCLAVSSMRKEKNQIKKSVLHYLPIILMVLFIIWTFISCLQAPGVADDYLTEQEVKQLGAMPELVLSKTFNGCYNLKDGFWAFLMYGTVLLGAMVLLDNNQKKKLIIGFVAVMTFLSIITIPLTVKNNNLYKELLTKYTKEETEKYDKAYEQYVAIYNSGDYDEELMTREQFVNIGRKNAAQKAENEALADDYYGTKQKFFVGVKSAIFRNSNHFAYVLCMAIMASALLLMIEKRVAIQAVYLICFSLLLVMLLLNNTFGGYLGVLVSVVCLVIYAIASAFNNRNKDISGFEKYKNLIFISCILLVFVALSLTVTGRSDVPIAVEDLKGFARDIGNFGGYMTGTENPTEVDVSTLDQSIAKAGSGRGETWIKVWELIEQRPLFGYGLECLLFQFSGQFDVGEGRTHNLLLQLLATVGIPGTIMYFTALAIIFIRLLKNWKTWNDIEKICVFVGIAYMVTALTGNSTYYTSPYFMMFLGFVALTPWKKNNSEEVEISKVVASKK